MNDEDNHPMTDEAQAYLDKYDKRLEQGLGFFPHKDTGPVFVRLGDDGKPYRADAHEVLRAVSGWYVKKDNKFHDVENLQTKFAPHDVKQVVVQRIKVQFPTFHLDSGGWADFFKVLLDPPVNDLDPEKPSLCGLARQARSQATNKKSYSRRVWLSSTCGKHQPIVKPSGQMPKPSGTSLPMSYP